MNTTPANRPGEGRPGHPRESLAPLPNDRAALLVLHRAARRRRDAAPLHSEERAEAMLEIGRIEVQIARVERAMDPPLV